MQQLCNKCARDLRADGLATGDELLAEPTERHGDGEKALDEKPREPVDGRPQYFLRREAVVRRRAPRHTEILVDTVSEIG